MSWPQCVMYYVLRAKEGIIFLCSQIAEVQKDSAARPPFSAIGITSGVGNTPCHAIICINIQVSNHRNNAFPPLQQFHPSHFLVTYPCICDAASGIRQVERSSYIIWCTQIVPLCPVAYVTTHSCPLSAIVLQTLVHTRGPALCTWQTYADMAKNGPPLRAMLSLAFQSTRDRINWKLISFI